MVFSIIQGESGLEYSYELDSRSTLAELRRRIASQAPQVPLEAQILLAAGSKVDDGGRGEQQTVNEAIAAAALSTSSSSNSLSTSPSSATVSSSSSAAVSVVSPSSANVAPSSSSPPQLFLFDKRQLTSDSPTLADLPHLTLRALSDLSDVGATDAVWLRALENLVSGAHWSLRALENLVDAISCATDNLRSHLRQIMQAFAVFHGYYKQKHAAHEEQLHSFERDLAELEGIELHPSLRSTNLLRLLDCVPQDTFRKWAAECGVQHDLFRSKVGELERLLRNTSDAAEATAAAATLDTAADLPQRRADVNTLDELLRVSSASATVSHDTVQRALKAFDRLERGRSDLTSFVWQRLQRVARLQGQMKDVANRVVSFNAALHSHRKAFLQLQFIRRLPSAYHAALVECARRHEFGEALRAQLASLNEHWASTRQAELTLRKQFLESYFKDLPQGLFDALRDGLPSFSLKMHRFDENLPDIRRESLDQETLDKALSGAAAAAAGDSASSALSSSRGSRSSQRRPTASMLDLSRRNEENLRALQIHFGNSASVGGGPGDSLLLEAAHPIIRATAHSTSSDTDTALSSTGQHATVDLVPASTVNMLRERIVELESALGQSRGSLQRSNEVEELHSELARMQSQLRDALEDNADTRLLNARLEKQLKEGTSVGNEGGNNEQNEPLIKEKKEDEDVADKQASVDSATELEKIREQAARDREQMTDLISRANERVVKHQKRADERLSEAQAEIADLHDRLSAGTAQLLQIQHMLEAAGSAAPSSDDSGTNQLDGSLIKAIEGLIEAAQKKDRERVATEQTRPSSTSISSLVASAPPSSSSASSGKYDNNINVSNRMIIPLSVGDLSPGDCVLFYASSPFSRQSSDNNSKSPRSSTRDDFDIVPGGKAAVYEACSSGKQRCFLAQDSFDTFSDEISRREPIIGELVQLQQKSAVSISNPYDVSPGESYFEAIISRRNE